MPAIAITTPTRSSQQEIAKLFGRTIRHTFEQEGIADSHAHDIPVEVATQIATLEQFLTGSGVPRWFLAARMDDAVVGTIAAGSANEIIRANLDVAFDLSPEIKCAYVLPEWQGKGVGLSLLREILQILQQDGVHQYCLDCGYTRAQRFWRRRLGEPAVVLADQYGPGAHHMIWHGSVAEALSGRRV